jgi:hypothetical protein
MLFHVAQLVLIFAIVFVFDIKVFLVMDSSLLEGFLDGISLGNQG